MGVIFPLFPSRKLDNGGVFTPLNAYAPTLENVTFLAPKRVRAHAGKCDLFVLSKTLNRNLAFLSFLCVLVHFERF